MIPIPLSLFIIMAVNAANHALYVHVNGFYSARISLVNMYV